MKKYFFFLLIFSCFSTSGFSTTLSGLVTEEGDKPLPFVNVYLQGTTIGTTANIAGKFSLDLKPGSYDLVFRLIGYKQHVEKITVAESPVLLNVKLFPEAYQLKEVHVNASAEDPAYAIIRNAQKKRKAYLNEVKSYSCDAYVKSTQKMISHPDKILGMKVDMSETIDSTTGIFYLSESVSKLYVKRPDRTKEIMVSSKVSGHNRSFSFNQATDLMIDFYESLIQFGDLSERGFVSPLSSSAMFYYKYRLEGTFFENGETVNKIKVIPKRSTDPVFQGDIYILDDSWRIHSTDLFITKDQQIEFLDTLQIHQSYVPVEKNAWMSFSSQLSYVFGIFGFHGRGVVLGINNNYNVHPDFAPHFFDGEVMKINKEANKKDSSYWEQARPIPLIAEERKDYHTRDSTSVVYESKSYRDSMDREDNKFDLFGTLLTGYSYSKSYSKESFYISPLISNVQFNTVEGLNLSLSLSHSKRSKDDPWRRRTYGTNVRYGFSNHHFNGNIFYHGKYDPDKLASYVVAAGSDMVQFNNNKPISELINTAYSLMGEKNFMKIYEKRFISAGHMTELVNGIRLETSAEYADRLPLVNTTRYSFINVKNREYISNDPLYPESDSLHFRNNQSLSLDINVRIRFRQEYMSTPDGKHIIGSKYPALKLFYRKGIKDIAGSDVCYDFISGEVSDRMRLGLLGTFEYNVSYGRFVNKQSVYLMDAHHFNGNLTFLSSFGLNDFKLLDYYRYSTVDPYFEAHAEHNFGGLFLNKIPLIRKLKLNEVGGVHYFHTDQLKNYLELSIGIEKLSLFRVDFVTSFADGKKASAGFVFGLKGIF